MIIATLVLLLVLGGGNEIDFSDPKVRENFRNYVGYVVEEPVRAEQVYEGVVDMSSVAQEISLEVEQDVKRIKAALADPNISEGSLIQMLEEIQTETYQQNLKIIKARERMRLNTTKGEWKELLKLSERG